jgi:anti-anti-sigma regulatory factor
LEVGVSGHLECRIETQGGVITVRVSGQLDLLGVAHLRTIVLRALAQGPLAIVIDLADVTLANGAYLTALF